MKRLLPLVLLLLFVSAVTNAQITKGSLLLGGSLYASHSIIRNPGPDNNAKSSSLGINPSIGIAIQKNMILGFGFTASKSKSGNDTFNKLNEEWGGNVYMRNYFPIGNNFNLFLQTAAYYSHMRMVNHSPNYDDFQHTKAIGLSFLPGVDYALNKKFHLELTWNDLLTVSYNHSTANNPTSETEDKWWSANTNTGALNPVSVGFRFLLSK
jgi:hypothetical protein